MISDGSRNLSAAVFLCQKAGQKVYKAKRSRTQDPTSFRSKESKMN